MSTPNNQNLACNPNNENIDTELSIPQQCWKHVIDLFGTAYIFKQRANNYKKKIQILSYFGFFGPLLIGGLVGIGFTTSSNILSRAVLIAGFIALVQLVIGLWAIIAKWDDRLANSVEAMLANNRLSNSFRELAKNPTNTIAHDFQLLNVELQNREEVDLKENITDKELRLGMRASLRQLGKKCAGCQEVPKSMEATNCPVCGKFGLRYLLSK